MPHICWKGEHSIGCKAFLLNTLTQPSRTSHHERNNYSVPSRTSPRNSRTTAAYRTRKEKRRGKSGISSSWAQSQIMLRNSRALPCSWTGMTAPWLHISIGDSRTRSKRSTYIDQDPQPCRVISMTLPFWIQTFTNSNMKKGSNHKFPQKRSQAKPIKQKYDNRTTDRCPWTWDNQKDDPRNNTVRKAKSFHKKSGKKGLRKDIACTAISQGTKQKIAGRRGRDRITPLFHKEPYSQKNAPTMYQAISELMAQQHRNNRRARSKSLPSPSVQDGY